MKAAINKVGSQVHQQGPFHRICYYQPHAMASEQLNKLLVDEALMANLNGVAHGGIMADLEAGTLIQTLIVVARQLSRLLSRPRQHGKEEIEPLGLKLEVWGQLPENGTEFRAELEQPLGKEVRQRPFDLSQAAHMS